MTTTQSTQQASLTLPQRIIRSVGSSREYAVLLLVAFAVAAEYTVLVSTQQYEAATAPAGVTLIMFGMSAGGLVVFSVEFLKLGVAWFAGTVTGWTRVACNVIMIGLCLLTAMTIKDIHSREWFLSLAPYRDATATIAALEAQVQTLDDKAKRLQSGSEKDASARGERSKLIRDQLNDIATRTSEEEKRFRGRTDALGDQAVAPIARSHIEARREARDHASDAANADIEEMTIELRAAESVRDSTAQSDRDADSEARKQVADERSVIQRANEAAEKRALEQHERETVAFERDIPIYNQQRKDYESGRSKLADALNANIAKLREQDGAFFNIEEKIRAAKAETQAELDRLESEWKAVAIPKRPLLSKSTPQPLPEFVAQVDSLSPNAPQHAAIVSIQARIDSRVKERDAASKQNNVEINRLLEEAQASSTSSSVRIAEEQRMLEAEHKLLRTPLDGRRKELLEQQRREQQQQDEFARSPAEIERELQEIPGEIAELETQVGQLRGGASRLEVDTLPSRFAAMLRYFMPEKTTEELRDAAFAIFPPAIGILGAFIPALLVELGAHSLATPASKRAEQRWNLIRRCSRGRRALEIERARAQKLIRLTSAEREEGKRLLGVRLAAMDNEVSYRAQALNLELTRERDRALLDKELADRKREVEGADAQQRMELAFATEKQHSSVIIGLRKDNERLMTSVITLDAQHGKS